MEINFETVILKNKTLIVYQEKKKKNLSLEFKTVIQ